MGGGGGKGGGGGHTPIEQPNTLESAQKLKIIDLLCEGVAGHDVSFKNIFLDNTPIQNEDGSFNFTGIRVSALPGTHDQDYLSGFDTTDKVVSVGAEVKADKPITRTITDPLIDRLRVTVALGSLVTMKDNGDRVGGEVSLTVTCSNKSYPITITGKTTSAYHQDIVIDELPDVPFNVTVIRNTPDSTSDQVSNQTHWVSYVESIDAKFSYPHSVVVGMEIDSAQFGGKVPKRTYLNKWTQIKVPNNYDPENRTYDGVWNGQFKTAWSNNPAWVFYDLVTDKRYGLGDRLGEFGCDKWSLYQIAKCCDQIVPDGFGGEEPRFTCNAYLSEPRDAKALLDDLASVFRGIAVWDGQSVMALQDAKKDPVATYSNSNVVNGAFEYSGSAQKTIFTAVHVKYNDKTDNYATKTEYVSNDEAIKRYGLNVKQITAFGCTSRGQAARVGKWLIETSIRERQAVSFKVGREGIRHLPFDIIEIADNDYAGDMIAGRVLSVSGSKIIIDREITDIDSIRYYASGQSKTINVSSISGKEITLEEEPSGITQFGVFSATKTDVKPRLFRALSIKEDDGTYTISAIQHDENKEAIVDNGVTFEQDSTATKHKPQVGFGRVSKDGDELLVAWEGANTQQYLIKLYRNGELYKSFSQKAPEIRLKGLPNGNYKAEIRGKSPSGKLTEPVIKEWEISYDIQGLRATPELFAIKLDWTNPNTVINKAKIEIYRSQTNDRKTAKKIATLSYPTDTFMQNGVKLSEIHYFWLRIVDELGNHGEWATISGQCSDDASAIIESINGKITKSVLGKKLINELTADISESIKIPEVDLTEINKGIDELEKKAQQQGTKISEIEKSDKKQSKTIKTLTAADKNILAGLEAEKKARANGDTAEAQQRLSLVGKVRENKSSITSLTKTVTDNNQSTAEQLTQLTSKVDKSTRRYDGDWYINKTDHGFDFVFPPTDEREIVIDILQNDLEGSCRLLLNGNVISRISSNDAVTEWKSFVINKHINKSKDNVVRIEDSSNGDDWGHIYAVVWRENLATSKAVKATEAKITSLSKTVATNNTATAKQITQLTAAVTPRRYDWKNGTSFYGKQVTCKFPATNANAVFIKFRATDVEKGVEVFLNGVKVASGFGGKDNEDKWYSFKVTENINHNKPNIVRIGDLEKKDGGNIYSVIWAEENLTDDKAQSTYTIKTQAIAGGKTALAGIAVGAMANESTAESSVIVMADKFGVVKNSKDGTVKSMFSVVNNKVAVNGDLIANGTILGKHIKANQTITAPKIKGGELNINNRFKVDRYGHVTIQDKTNNVGLKIKDNQILVYDEKGNLRVKLGKLK